MPKNNRRPIVHDLAVVPGYRARQMLEHDSATIRIDSSRFVSRDQTDEYWSAGSAELPRPEPKKKRRKK